MQPAAEGVRVFFENEARRFDSIYTGPRSVKEHLIDRLFHRVIRLRFEKTMQLIGDLEGSRVLDVGCGPGNYTVAMAGAGAAQAIGVDFAGEMVQLAKAKAAQHGVEDRCSWESGDFLQTELFGPFDACVAIGYFEYLEDPVAHLQRMMQLTNGTIVASFPKRYTLRTPPRAVRYRLRGCFLRFYTRRDIQRLAETAGLTDFEIHSVSRDHLLCARSQASA